MYSVGGKHDAFLNWNKYFNLSCAKQVGNLMQLLLRVQSKILNKKGGGEPSILNTLEPLMQLFPGRLLFV